MARPRGVRDIDRDLTGLIKRHHQLDDEIRESIQRAAKGICMHDQITADIDRLIDERQQYEARPSHLRHSNGWAGPSTAWCASGTVCSDTRER